MRHKPICQLLVIGVRTQAVESELSNGFLKPVGQHALAAAAQKKSKRRKNRSEFEFLYLSGDDF